MSDPQPASLLWERTWRTAFAVIVAFIVGAFWRANVNPEVVVVPPPEIVTAQTSAPATPADVTP